MEIQPGASDRTEHFIFESGDCLYRDHHGHRVLADWEGPGTVHLIRCEIALHINGLLYRGVLFPYRFEGPVTISTNEEGTFEAVITGNWCRVPTTKSQELVLDTFSIFEAKLVSNRNWTVQNLSAPHFLESQYEDGTKHSDNVASLLNACSFDVRVPANCIVLRISKTYDQFHGRQCARVWCDDDFKGLWYLPRQNRAQRWAKAWFGFEIEPTPDEKIVRITMDPPGGTPMWSMSDISVVGLFLNP